VSLFLVLPNQHGQVEAEAVVAVAVTLAVAVVTLAAALLEAALAPRQPSTVAAFELHRLSAAHTSPAEVLAGQLSHLDSIMVVIACLPCGRRDSPAQSVHRQDRMSTGSPQRLGNQTAQAQLQHAAVRQISGFRRLQIVSQIA